MTRPKVAIVGLGLIGGSVGLALRKAEPSFEIVGHDKDGSTSKKAQKIGAVEKAERNLISAIDGAQLVIIATPALAIKDIFEAVAPHLRPDCVVTDTSNVKQEVLDWADDLLPDSVHFVGGDPMVSSDQAGIDAATADLFTGSTYCVVPSVKAHPAAIELVTSLARTLGAEPYFLDAAEHDGQIVGVDQLPHIAATALLMTTALSSVARDISRLPSRTFWRATHLPFTNRETYRDMCLTNRENISRWIDQYVDNLRGLQQRIGAADGEAWEDLFSQVRDERSRWLAGRITGPEEEASATLQELGGFRSMTLLLGLDSFGPFRPGSGRRVRK